MDFFGQDFFHAGSGGTPGSPPDFPTFSVADNADGTGGVVTIAGSTAGATNVFYAATLSSGGAVGAFVQAGSSRVGDGTIAIAPGNGTYLGIVQSTGADGQIVISLPDDFTLTQSVAAGHTGHFWIDVKTTLNGDGQAITQASFWPMAYQSAHEPTALTALRDRPGSYSNVILGCRDGYLRRHQSNLAQDDGNYAIPWYLEYGPLQLAGVGEEGILAEVVGVMAAGSGDVDWAVRVGKSFQAAFDGSTFDLGSWNDAGLSYTAQPRARGQAFVLRLSNGESNAATAIESITAIVEEGGKLRR